MGTGLSIEKDCISCVDSAPVGFRELTDTNGLIGV